MIKFIGSALFALSMMVGWVDAGDTVWVDSALSTDSSNTYSFANHNGAGSDGQAYKKLQWALRAHVKGEHVVLRTGTYFLYGDHFTLPYQQNGESWAHGYYNELRSADGEWAILDGENNIPDVSFTYLMGSNVSPVRYWKIERIGFTRATNASGTQSKAFYADGGPFIIRYNHFFHNFCTVVGQNPSCINGHLWNNSTIEYNYFQNNGENHSGSENITSICLFSDYSGDAISANGLTISADSNHCVKNIIRFNLFDTGSTGVRICKTTQLLTGRDSVNNGYVDTYDTFGNSIYNNIFKNLKFIAVMGDADFIRINNNVISDCGNAIRLGWDHTPYRGKVYNNTMYRSGGVYFNQLHTAGVLNFESQIYATIINNLIDSTNASASNQEEFAIYVPVEFTYAKQDSAKISNNFALRTMSGAFDGDGTLLFFINGSRYTTSEYHTAFGSTNWRGGSASGLYLSWMIPDGAFVVNGATTISDGGYGGVYPSYIGAVDPNNKKWVNNVLNLVNVRTLSPIGGKISCSWSVK